jgi:hypothetical protein
VSCTQASSRAVKLYNESLALFREVGDTYGTSLSLLMTAEAAYTTGNYERARNLGQECLKVNGQLGDRRGAGITLELLGRVAQAQGEGTAARAPYPGALSAERRGRPVGDGTLYREHRRDLGR